MGILLKMVPWWGRWLMIAGAFLAAAAFGAVRMHQHDEKALDKEREDFAVFRGKVAANGVVAKQAAEAVRQRDVNAAKEAQHGAEEDQAHTHAQFSAAMQQLRDNVRTAGDVVPAATGRTSVPEGSVCFSREGLAKGISGLFQRAQDRLGKDFQGCAGQLDLLNRAAEWAAKIGAPAGKPLPNAPATSAP